MVCEGVKPGAGTAKITGSGRVPVVELGEGKGDKAQEGEEGCEESHGWGLCEVGGVGVRAVCEQSR